MGWLPGYFPAVVTFVSKHLRRAVRGPADWLPGVFPAVRRPVLVTAASNTAAMATAARAHAIGRARKITLEDSYSFGKEQLAHVLGTGILGKKLYGDRSTEAAHRVHDTRVRDTVASHVTQNVPDNIFRPQKRQAHFQASVGQAPSKLVSKIFFCPIITCEDNLAVRQVCLWCLWCRLPYRCAPCVAPDISNQASFGLGGR